MVLCFNENLLTKTKKKKLRKVQFQNAKRKTILQDSDQEIKFTETSLNDMPFLFYCLMTWRLSKKDIIRCYKNKLNKEQSAFQIIKSFIILTVLRGSVNDFEGPSPRHWAQATQLLSKKSRSGSELLATLCQI